MAYENRKAFLIAGSSYAITGIGVLAVLERRPVIPPRAFPSRVYSNSKGRLLGGFLNTEWKPQGLESGFELALMDLALAWINCMVLSKSLSPCGL